MLAAVEQGGHVMGTQKPMPVDEPDDVAVTVGQNCMRGAASANALEMGLDTRKITSFGCWMRRHNPLFLGGGKR